MLDKPVDECQFVAGFIAAHIVKTSLEEMTAG